jgi:hypothetical protein
VRNSISFKLKNPNPYPYPIIFSKKITLFTINFIKLKN